MGVYSGVSQDNVIINSGSATLNRLSLGAPVTKTADFTLGASENWVINNKAGSACVVTLPAASAFPGRVITFKTVVAFAVNSASSNVVPRAGGAAAAAITGAVAGNWSTIVSDGTNWVQMAGS